MSFFKVEKTKLAKVYPHPNADRLELANVEDKSWQFVIKKDEFKEGQDVVFFPIDSLIPKELSDHFGITAFLGSGGRVKSIRLRKEPSQGFVSSVESVVSFLEKNGKIFNDETLTEDLGVIKWEIAMPIVKNAILRALPSFVKVYDIEGVNNNPKIVDLLMEQKVFITEKMEGSNFCVALDETGDVTVCQRRFSILKKEVNPDEEQTEHTFMTIAKDDGIIDFAKTLQEKEFPNQTIAVRGEALGEGIQKNYYNLSKHTTRLFDIEVNGQALDADKFISLLEKYSMKDKCVPVLCNGEQTLKEWLNGKTVQDAANGKSVVIDKLREGIVIKPIKEQYVDRFGRLFIKHRSFDYLEATGF